MRPIYSAFFLGSRRLRSHRHDHFGTLVAILAIKSLSPDDPARKRTVNIAFVFAGLCLALLVVRYALMYFLAVAGSGCVDVAEKFTDYNENFYSRVGACAV